MGYLEIRALNKVYRGRNGTVEALRGIDLSVREGEFVALLGPSGCGKTTLLQIVAGLESPSAGEVLLRNQVVRGWSRERTLIFQEYTLFPWLTARGNVEFGLRLAGIGPAERRERALAALGRLGVAAFAEALPHQLSGGMQQRVALARSLVLDPALLLLDEPFAAVDAITRRRLQAELREVQRSGGQTVLLVTHSVHEALVLADRIVVLSARPATVQIELPVPRPLSPAEMASWEEEVLRSLSSDSDH
jgi:ABC-type nitrate/sulfonate/bicarbonate transport system ATPase subunit